MHVEVKGSHLGTPGHRTWTSTNLTRFNHNIDQIVINDHRVRPNIEVRVGLEEPVIDNNIAVHMRDPRCPYLLRKLVHPRQRVFWRECHSLHKITRIAVIEIGEIHGAIRFGASPHREITLGDQHEGAIERAIAPLPHSVDRRSKVMIKAEVIESR